MTTLAELLAKQKELEEKVRPGEFVRRGDQVEHVNQHHIVLKFFGTVKEIGPETDLYVNLRLRYPP